MADPQDKNRPEAGADTRFGKPGEGAKARDADSGGDRSAAGSTYGDYVPNRGQPRQNDDRDHAQDQPMGDYYTGGGNLDRLAEEPATAGPQAGADPAGASPTAHPDATDEERRAAAEEERVAEANRNRTFDTTHVHSGTTSRRV
jgi:hypothetical protein